MGNEAIDIQDDDIIAAMIAAGARAIARIRGKSSGEFFSDEVAVDALAGCVLTMAEAAHDVSEHVRNWTSQVDWEALDRIGQWRTFGVRSEARREELWSFTQVTLPAIVAGLVGFSEGSHP